MLRKREFSVTWDVERNLNEDVACKLHLEGRPGVDRKRERGSHYMHFVSSFG